VSAGHKDDTNDLSVGTEDANNVSARHRDDEDNDISVGTDNVMCQGGHSEVRT
jgi:hypothetical protein